MTAGAWQGKKKVLAASFQRFQVLVGLAESGLFDFPADFLLTRGARASIRRFPAGFEKTQLSTVEDFETS